MNIHMNKRDVVISIGVLLGIGLLAFKNRDRIAAAFGASQPDDNSSPSIPFLIKSFQAPANLSHWTTNPDWHNKSFFNGYGKKSTK